MNQRHLGCNCNAHIQIVVDLGETRRRELRVGHVPVDQQTPMYITKRQLWTKILMLASGLMRNYTEIAQHLLLPPPPRVMGLSRSEPLRGDDLGITRSLATTKTAAHLNVNVICNKDIERR